MLHDPKEVRVEANIKETPLRKLKLGQPPSKPGTYPETELDAAELSHTRFGLTSITRPRSFTRKGGCEA